MADNMLEEDRLVMDMHQRGYGIVVRRREVQDILSITRLQALKLIREGKLESTRLGTHYRVPVRSIARYLSQGSSPPKPSV